MARSFHARCSSSFERRFRDPGQAGNLATLIAGPLATIVAALALPGQASAQSCNVVGNVYTCTVPSGPTYTAPIYFNQSGPLMPNSNPNSTQSVDVEGFGDVSMTSSSPLGPWGLSMLGVDVAGAVTTQIFGPTYGLVVDNRGSMQLSADPATTSIPNAVFGIYARQTASGRSSSQAGVSVTNSGAIAIDLSGIQTSGGAAIWASDRGGGKGGNSVGVSVVNSGAIAATLAGSLGGAGIQAISYGGYGGFNLGFGLNNYGGDGGAASILNSGAVNLAWTWQGVGSNNAGVFGLQAKSAGWDGTDTNVGSAAGNAGDAGNGGSATVTLTPGADVTVTVNGTPPSTVAADSAGVLAEVVGGNGGTAGISKYDTGGDAGNANGPATIGVTDASVGTTGDLLPGLLILQQGGAGGYAGCQDGPNLCGTLPDESAGYQNGGTGGQVLGSGVITVIAAARPVTISTTGDQSSAIEALLVGGAAGAGGSDHTSVASGTGGAGGVGGAVFGAATIHLGGTGQNLLTVSTAGDHSAGVYAASVGGDGGAGGGAEGDTGSTGGDGGDGGWAGDVTVDLSSTSIGTQGTLSPGIFAQSAGGAGGTGGSANGALSSTNAGSGGGGGQAGDVSVTLDGASKIQTQGDDSAGILAQSLGGAGGDGSNAVGGGDTGGSGGAGGAAGDVTVTNNGAITTAGDTARGILAQSLSATAGAGGYASGLTSQGGSGGSSGTAGAVVVTQDGSVVTTGSNAEGVLLQSIGGNGGAGGQGAGGFTSVGGSSDSNPFLADGNTVTFASNGGSIQTSGVSAIGVLGQSIGGGGGDGGGGVGIFNAVGGNGGRGGDGDTVTATLGSGSQIVTQGDGAMGVLMQSIGGGGGNAGNATANAPFVSIAVGGQGGEGGDGDDVTVSTDGATIVTSGSRAPGIVLQSIGGGGGTGGEAFSSAVGAGFAAAKAVGGQGGGAGDGQTALLTVSGGSIATGQVPLLINGNTAASGNDDTPQAYCTSLPCNVLPADSYGVLVQSIGGGGGLGGSAMAQATAVAIPVQPDGAQLGVASTSAVGGQGGSAGNGGSALFGLSSGGTITTSGQGAAAVLVQSVGGGGGVGGDSSALSAVYGYDASSYLEEGAPSLAVTVEHTVGGQGGGGGDGGLVSIAIGGTVASDGTITADEPGSGATSIVTYGDFADGVKAQSIGGGGGDAGFGSGSTQSFGTGLATSVGVNVGAQGGDAGEGGNVTVDLFAGNGITTYGSGAIGIMAQSVGGGGGASQGGSFTFSTTFNVAGQDFKPGINLGVGKKGTGGGDGQDVTVSVAAPITTYGGDATGVLAQSIGGGGGVGGSAGSDASADNPIVRALAEREGINEFRQFLTSEEPDLPPINLTYSHSVGGQGGTGGGGGQVTVDLSAAVTTSGDWANGILAQSVGGGGGKAGWAAASGTGGVPEITLNYDAAVGGSGGAGGAGGQVNINLDQGYTAVSTAGYGATAIIGQSVGGGGGIAADGSDSAIGALSVGAQSEGSSGVGGSGGEVYLQFQNDNGTAIVTTGDAADGILLQSIGGGGGIAGAGSSTFSSLFRYSGKTTTLTVGGVEADGDGNGVTLQQAGSYDTGNIVSISTKGAYSFGILAQSIGGGGGLVTVQPSTDSVATTLGGSSSTGQGGSVNVVATNNIIVTSGVGAHGIAAQSIGGGGGFVRVADPGDSPALTRQWDTSTMTIGQGGGAGDGGSVYVYAGGMGSINVSGAGAIGIVAQSVGGGGGITMNGNAMFAGSTSYAGNGCSEGPCGIGGPVKVQVGGPVSATGANGIGIFAQSAGYGQNDQVTVQIDAGGIVTGGSGTAATPSNAGAAGVWLDGSESQLKVYSDGTVTTVAGTDGTAVIAFGSASISNSGTITGSVYGATNAGPASDLAARAPAKPGAGSSATLTMANHGTYNAGAVMDGDLRNAGLVNVGLPGEVRFTNLTGDFIQTGSGRLGVTIDSLNATASRLNVQGGAAVEGVIVPWAITLLPGSLPVLTAGDLDTHADAADSLIFRWDAATSGKTVSVTPFPTFLPAGVSLTASQASLANYHAQAWNNADPGLAYVFAEVSHITEADDYTALLDEYSSKDIYAQPIAFANSAGAILGSSMSCPVFVDKGVLLGEDDCGWFSVSGRWSDQDTTADTQGYRISGPVYRVGLQRDIAPDWYLGGSFAYGQTSADMEGGSTGDGDTYDGSISLKHTVGSWFFAGSLALGYGAFDVDRRVNLPGGGIDTLESDPSIFLAGGRLRAGYQFAMGDWYVRPYGDLDVIYTHLPGVTETGSAIHALDAESSGETQVTLSAMLEIGGRVDLDERTTLRPYIGFGASYLSDNSRTIGVRFFGETGDNGGFTDVLEQPDLLGKVDLGLQLYRDSKYELKAGYSADIGDSFTSQSASARFAIHF